MINANLPWVESPFFEEALKLKNLSGEQTKLVKDYHNNGYVVIPGLLPLELIDRVQHDVEKIGFDPTIKIKRRNEQRIQDFWLRSEAVKELACFPVILEILGVLYGRKPLPFQTLNFRVGSEQKAHSDTIHFSSLPARFMCGVWVALQDITEESGPVFYYPGSHKLPEYNFSHIKADPKLPTYDDYPEYEEFIGGILAVNGLKKEKFVAKKGDLFIWSSNIIHGGSPVTKEGASRWSQVTHYFFEDCYYYTPMLSNMVTNELFLRNNLKDIQTGELMKQSYNGTKLNSLKTRKNLFMLTSKIPGILSYIKSLI